MRPFTLDDLRAVMRGCAGVDENVDLDGAIGDVEYADLGYDSLALLEIQKLLERQLDLSLPENALAEVGTPSRTVEHVNVLLASAPADR